MGFHRNLEGRWRACNVSGIRQPSVDAICYCWSWDSGNLHCAYTIWRHTMLLSGKTWIRFKVDVPWLICDLCDWRPDPFTQTLFCQEQEINDELEFLIIASDGLWDVVPNEVSFRSDHEHLSSRVIIMRFKPGWIHDAYIWIWWTDSWKVWCSDKQRIYHPYALLHINMECIWKEST